MLTQQKVTTPIFGLPKKLSGTNLPTYKDVLLSCFEESYKNSILSGSKKKVAFSTIADNVATQIEIIYRKASIPVVTHTRAVQMINAYHNAYNNLRKSYKRDQKKEGFKDKIERFVAEAKSKLFESVQLGLPTVFDLSSVPYTSQIRLNLTSTALVSDRFGISDRATAAIASSVLHDVGIISEEDTSQIIDKSKIRRQKQKIRQAIRQDASIVTKGLYFDGRKDNTIYQQKIGAKLYRRVKKEEHISLIREPGGQYVGHVTPSSATGSELSKYIVKYLHDNDIDINELEAIGCDVVQTTRYLPDGIKKIIDPVIQRNAFFCHPENMLLAMIVDEREHIRELGYSRVLRAKTEIPKGKSVRNFVTPLIHFDATDYTELIDWTKCKLSSPPILERPFAVSQRVAQSF
ncbi:unnamed protein product [Brassicogethes aeneus]|uniref:Uncharacterized protein n=1 Tax=Brassicogethes aeneus TaxID=1431903 RepID=A0A9P0BBN7_BRAAE|nr:unnamed protein product [Brassicogethes aeneus]